MPKDEFDLDDPLELNGVALYTEEDTQRDMAECFVQEFLLLDHNHQQLLAIFRNPNYLGMNMVLRNKGEGFVKEVISDVYARWGRKIHWGDDRLSQPDLTPPSPPINPQPEVSDRTDPFGNPIPKLNI